ncbi:MAG TPA: ABC transporter permease [Candidatus Xenobia bacterium]|nr:ABC transporter permease [Candidatus Xenobia bacterium]
MDFKTWLASGSLWWRELVRFYRYRSRVVGALGTPLVFWLLLGAGIGKSFRSTPAAGELTYLEYFFPGTILLILLFTSIFTMMSVIEDRREGFLLSVLVAPVAPTALVIGKILGGATLAVLQGLLFVLLAPTAGVPLHPVQLLFVTGLSFLIALGLTAMGFLVAWKLDSTQGFHAVVNLFLIPMWLLSGALFPAAGASEWIRWVMRLNPLTYGMAALRELLYWPKPTAVEGPPLAVSLAVTAAFALAMFLAALWLVGQPAAEA